MDFAGLCFQASQKSIFFRKQIFHEKHIKETLIILSSFTSIPQNKSTQILQTDTKNSTL